MYDMQMSWKEIVYIKHIKSIKFEFVTYPGRFLSTKPLTQISLELGKNIRQ
jgi:hypothetical protein